jgi:hypothetical protein
MIAQALSVLRLFPTPCAVTTTAGTHHGATWVITATPPAPSTRAESSVRRVVESPKIIYRGLLHDTGASQKCVT